MRTGLVLISVVGACAHGRLTKPDPRAPIWRDANMQGHTDSGATYRENEPPFTLSGPMTHNGHPYSDSSYRCHDFAAQAPSTVLHAGAALELEWTIEALHPGDCALYISYDETTTASEGYSTWFKIADFPGCVDQAALPGFDGLAPLRLNKWSITLPPWLPSTSHAVLRWEWLAVQQVTNVEFYVSCVDVRVDGPRAADASTLSQITGRVTIKGIEHLPQDASAYRKAYNNEFGLGYIVGPAVATFGGTATPYLPPAPSPAPPAPSSVPAPPPSAQPSPPLASPPLPPRYPRGQGHAHLKPTSASWAAIPAHVLSLERLDEFKDTLTSIVGATSEGEIRAVHSSGGAASGVVSEGQGYGLLLAGVLAAALPASHTRRGDILNFGHELFLGWQRMCERTTINSCQDTHFCGADGSHECLPSWKFDDTLSGEARSCHWAQEGLCTGSAPDGDEDAILGMMLLVLATEKDSERPSWRNGMGIWAVQSARAFLEHQTVVHPSRTASNGLPLRALKLGTCWGGWDCNNPSYHAPGHYRVMKSFMKRFDSLWPSNAVDAIDAEWDALIETSYLILNDSQCAANGLFPNWFVPNDGSTGCSGSGTPAAEFGSEAARTAWRLALDWLLHGEPEARMMSLRTAGQAMAKLAHYDVSLCSSAISCAALQLDTGCLIQSIHPDWTSLGFMLGPMASALTVSPTGSTNQQQAALNTASELLQRFSVADYYSGSWVAIATLTLSGDVASLAPLVASMANPLPLSPPSTVLLPPAALASPPHSPPPRVPTASSSPLATPPPPVAVSPSSPSPSPNFNATCMIPAWGTCGGSNQPNGCCSRPGDQCFQFNEWYSQCRPSCGGAEWDCAKQPMPPSAPSPPSVPVHCAVSTWGQCSADACCSSEGDGCFRQNEWYSQCRPSCPSEWECAGSRATSTFGASALAMGLAGFGVVVGLLILNVFGLFPTPTGILERVGLKESPPTENNTKAPQATLARDSIIQLDVDGGARPPPPPSRTSSTAITPIPV